ncbi:16S rRNA (adenine(1518)-N(6)/adenine(1519)-N(6))-dimethyltransferase RsmA [Magnetovibrio blakemorei]|uniref:Ribosomal RNA small subunit methyltransferase A n=1 Tax=Magnetovibrio blakemorei TaxID=28181 RepID=A0A1E5QAU5_9PROT|nr:16S rRNA (adenine(1518)-N(6)/adenine(1519)-N(6))-dimethyltransferase RsmA [Magnetovibrio blakemorei]OEJ68530.1 16S rRNA (adenine(1518)-N(6)/adenine(1519)-N(6))-dimethyltransferase [Magnetovibrio blakemorei]
MAGEFIDNLPPLRDIIARHDLAAKKQLGQNFLLDLNLTARIARTAGDLSETTVIEIGPGPGGLTRAILAAGAKKLIAIERDERCITALQDYLAPSYGDRFEIISGDALKQDFESLCPPPRRIMSNLPYNIATPLLIGWLKNARAYTGLTLMFQKEVADRITAKPRTKAYGRLSIMSQWQCEVHPEFNIDARAFTPPPKIQSTVVTFIPRPQPLAPASWDAMEKVTAQAFGQRRKMLRQSLKALKLNPEDVGIKETARAEELSVEDFAALARLYETQ